MPDVYEGSRPYIFVSYAHADDDAVMPLLEAFVREGYRVWWDRGIELATPFPDYIADHVHDCACFIPLVSRASLRSKWCNDEVNYALELNKTILPIYLEDVELPRGLHMQLCYRQHLTRSKFDNDAAMYRELFRAKALDSCLTPEGARRRGAKARDQQPKSTMQDVKLPVGRISIARSNVMIDVEQKSALVDYSWVELKGLSQAIVMASDDEWRQIAKAYCLTGKDGRLRGDEKSLVLKDGTKTAVRILGFRHDELTGGGKVGISFEFVDVPAIHHMNGRLTNRGGWQGSEMREWLNTSFFDTLPDDLRPLVAGAAKETNNKGEVSSLSDISVVTLTNDRLWLLSLSEVYGGLKGVYGAEGVQYELYATYDVTHHDYGFCKKGETGFWWWLRSPFISRSWEFCRVGRTGDYGIGDAYLDWGVSPGFCL